MSKTIHHKLFFPHPPEIVWDYLTKHELISQWLMESDFQPIVGFDFQFRTKPLPQFNFDGIVYCKVLAVAPFKKLSYSWKGGSGNGNISLDSIVEWTLLPEENGTQLQLVHSGFPEVDDVTRYTTMNDGWLRNIQRIASLIKSALNEKTNT